MIVPNIVNSIVYRSLGQLVVAEHCTSDEAPRQVIGTQAFSPESSLNSLKLRVVDQLHIRIETTELFHENKRILVISIPPRPIGQALNYQGAFLMRAGESLVPMTRID